MPGAPMQFATYHVFQCPPWQDPARVMREELERAVLSEQLGYDGIWVAEQHFAPYCLTGDALLVAGLLASRTQRAHVGTAVVNLTFTHPLRFAERVALLDHLTGGRVEVGVGRGYQFPQYGVFGVPIDETRAMFEEALDVILRAWEPEEFTFEGRYFTIPRVRIWPTPQRRPDQILLHAVNSAESVGRSIERGLPPLMARPITPFVDQLQELTTPTTTEMPRGYEFYERRGGRLPPFLYDEWLEDRLLFDDPDGCAEKIATLRDAGVRRLLLWMGVGGVDHDLVVQSMRLFAEQVMPQFR